MIETGKPVVSVIVPVYNTETWLEECLDSLIHQSLHEIEIVCVNDGSTDSSPEILKKKADVDNRIRIINQENSGLSEARNTGVRAASGEYLYFVDSDDLLVSDTLQVCVENMVRRNLEFLCFNMAAFGDDLETNKFAGEFNYKHLKRTLNDTIVYTGQALYAEMKQQKSYISPVGSCMLRRDAFLEHDLWFHPGILHEDEPWMLIALMSLSRCGCVNRILYRYRIRSNSITRTTMSFAHVYGLFAGIQDVKKLLHNVHDELVRELLVKHILCFQERTIYKYRLCSEEERQKRENLTPEERFLFEQTVVYPASLADKADQRENENQIIRQDKESLKQKAKETIKQKDKQIKKQEKEIGKRKIETAVLKQEKKKLQGKIKRVGKSETWRVGSIIIWLPGKGKKLLKKILRKQEAETVTGNATAFRKNKMKVFPSEVSGNRVVFRYDVVGEWSSCFRTDGLFEITYPFDIENIPESIRIIPFLSQILPVSWIYDAEIRVPVCDLDFHDCIEDVKAGYRKMYPMVSFGGLLTAESVEENRKPEQGQNVLACFSGGVDALSTTIAHRQEKPLLVSLWGSDVPSDGEENWRPVETLIRKNADEFGLETMIARTSFRKLLNGKILSEKIKETGDNWWHGFQHGLGILGHMAPVAWHESIGTVYIASSFTAKDQYTCASDPTIDSFIRFCGAGVVHDGYDLDRQEKIRRIVNFSKENNQQILMHVCWEKRGGDNCCHCEKCWRTMLGLYAEGADPRQYGFSLFEDVDRFSDDIERDFHRFWRLAEANYLPIQKKLREKMTEGDMTSGLSWFMQADLQQIQDGTLTLHEGKLIRPVWLLGTPDHRNMGDQCIAEEEIRFLHTVMPDRAIIEVSETDLKRNRFSQLEQVSSSQPVFLHGGGNLGTIWPTQEQLRNEILNRLKDHPVVIFPQSIWFEENEAGRKALDDARKIYQGDRILLCCRESVSYRFAQEQFDCKSILVPDMVLWESRQKPNGQERYGAMTLLRSDKERKLTDDDQTAIELILTERFHSLEVYDTVLKSGKVTRENRTTMIGNLVQRISSVECVVTDRLHGMILCAVTGTPCVVLPNGNPKVEAFQEWLASLGYIRLIHETEELTGAIDTVCSCTERNYPEREMRERFRELVRYIHDAEVLY